MASMGEQHFQVEHVMTGVPRMKCLECISDSIEAKKLGMEAPEIQDAITLAPTWVSKTVMGQLLFASVAVPSCMDHLTEEEKSPQQRAAEGGIILGGDGAGIG